MANPLFVQYAQCSEEILAECYPSYDAEVCWMVTSLNNETAVDPHMIMGSVGDAMGLLEQHYGLYMEGPYDSAADHISDLRENNGNVVTVFIIDLNHGRRIV